MQFNDVIESEAELRAMLGHPVVPAVVDKTLSRLDRHCTTFIQRAPFVLAAIEGLIEEDETARLY